MPAKDVYVTATTRLRPIDRLLREGDIVQNGPTGDAYVVTRTGGQHPIVTRSLELSNPDEWLLLEVLVNGKAD